MKIIMNFLIIFFFLTLIAIFIYSIVEKKRKEYKELNREGFSSSNSLRAGAIEYYLENIPNLIPKADYSIISDNVKNMRNTITYLNGDNSSMSTPVTQKQFDDLKNKFQINIDKIYNKLQNTNSIFKLNSGLTQMIDSLNNSFTLDMNQNY
jgi:predicted nucleotidyltransferase